MLKLHGFSTSNYFNVPKLAMLEKGVPFEEVEVYTGAGPKYRADYLDMSPMGKVPTLETPEGFISESRPILDYLERAHPETPLYPETAFGVGKVLEFTQVVDLYLELQVRKFIPNLFGGTEPEPAVVAAVSPVVEKAAKALAKLSDFEGYVYGDRLSAADLAAILHFPIVRLMGQRFLGGDPLSDVPGLTEYSQRMEERPHVQRVRADSQENMPKFMAHLQALYS